MLFSLHLLKNNNRNLNLIPQTTLWNASLTSHLATALESPTGQTHRTFNAQPRRHSPATSFHRLTLSSCESAGSNALSPLSWFCFTKDWKTGLENTEVGEKSKDKNSKDNKSVFFFYLNDLNSYKFHPSDTHKIWCLRRWVLMLSREKLILALALLLMKCTTFDKSLSVSASSPWSTCE